MPEGTPPRPSGASQNVGAILEGRGSGFDKVVKTTCFLTDIAASPPSTRCAGYFTSKPARSCVAVKDLPKGALCEIEAIAVK